MSDFSVLLEEIKDLRAENTTKFTSIESKLENISKKMGEMDIKLNRMDVTVGMNSSEILVLRSKTDKIDDECRTSKGKIDAAVAGGAAGGIGFLVTLGKLLGMI